MKRISLVYEDEKFLEKVSEEVSLLLASVDELGGKIIHTDHRWGGNIAETCSKISDTECVVFNPIGDEEHMGGLMGIIYGVVENFLETFYQGFQFIERNFLCRNIRKIYNLAPKRWRVGETFRKTVMATVEMAMRKAMGFALKNVPQNWLSHEVIEWIFIGSEDM